jgi:hypothetical protein
LQLVSKRHITLKLQMSILLVLEQMRLDVAHQESLLLQQQQPVHQQCTIILALSCLQPVQQLLWGTSSIVFQLVI